MTAGLDRLPHARQTDVLTAVCALESASGPVPATSYRALAEPVLREVVSEMLAAAGRVLVQAGAGYTSGYSDHIAERLAAEGTGTLQPDDRAVLTLVLLFSVAIPRAEGKIPAEASWTHARPVTRERLYGTHLKNSVIDSALQRLRDAAIVRAVKDGLIPGPQFDRLTPAMSAALFEELVLLAEPEGPLADSIRRRRLARRTPGPSETTASDSEEDSHGN
jgi:hypothetical protein